jgi:radical SAM protein with 4Fe4S-binding SPASM domain
MKRECLKPYVFKVEGPINVALYDFLMPAFHHMSLEGTTIEELRDYLYKEGLIFETEGVVPNKILIDNMWDVQDEVHLRVLQIRLNGRGEDTCWSRIKKDRQPQSMQMEALDRLKVECRYIPIRTIKIEAEDDDERIGKILKEFDYEQIELFVQNGIKPKDKEKYRTLSKIDDITFLENGKKAIKEINARASNFFYSKFFNPCLGHKVAVDTGGEIKCCLWSSVIIGNIYSDNLKSMIISGKFDDIWMLAKAEIDTCKDCELRCACSDCRVSAMAKTGNLNAKPPYCDYDPYTGDW